MKGLVMKKLFLTVLLLFSLSISASFNDFSREYRSGNLKIAESLIAVQYERNPQSDKICFWYGTTLYKNEKYVKAIEILSLVSSNFKPVLTLSTIAQCQLKIEETDKARINLEKAITYKSEKTIYKIFAFNLLLKIYSNYNPLKSLENNIINTENIFISFNKKEKPKNTELINYFFCKIFMNLAIQSMNLSKNIYYFERASMWQNSGLGQYASFINKNKIIIYKESCIYFKNNHTNKSKPLIHNIHFVGFSKFSGSYKSGKKIVNGKLTKGIKQKYNIVRDMKIKDKCTPSFNIFKMMVFYFTQGNVLLKASFSDLETTVTEINIGLWKATKGKNGKPLNFIQTYSPELNSLQPFPFEFFYNTYSKTDTYFIIYPFNRPIGLGGPGRIPLVPYTLYSPIRGLVKIADNKREMTPAFFMHEFFHIIENQYRNFNNNKYHFTAHTFKSNFNHIWPSWYNGQGEIFYYKSAFKNIITSLGFDPFKINSYENVISFSQFISAKSIFMKYDIKQIRQAYSLKLKGDNLFSSQNKNVAYNYYQKAYNIYPYFIFMNDRLRNYYNSKQNYHKTLEIELNSLKIDSKNPQRNKCIAYLYEKIGNNKKSIHFYKEYYTISQDPLALYNIGRISYKEKNIAQTLKYYNEYLEKGNNNFYRQYSLNNLIYNYVYNKNFKDLNKAITLSEKYYYIVIKTTLRQNIAFNTAVAYSQLKNKSKAIHWLNTAKKEGYSNIKNLNYYYNLNH